MLFQFATDNCENMHIQQSPYLGSKVHEM